MCRDGDLTYVRMRKNKQGRQTNVVFFGANFDSSFPSKNLYKALSVAKPDLVMVQLRPDYLLSGFEPWPTTYDYTEEQWKFCPMKYID